MTKILLVAINAKYIHSNPAVYSLKAYAGQAGKDAVEIVEYTINNRAEQILADLYAKRPGVIAFSCYIWNISMIEELIEDLSVLLPETLLWAGGPEVSSDPEAVCLRMPGLTGIMTGEGEETFKELLEWYTEYGKGKETEEGRRTLRDIRGLYLNHAEDGNGYTGDRPLPELDKIPFFYEQAEENNRFENKILYYESSRGCPFRCSYCLSSIDKGVRFRSLEKVFEELRFFLERKAPQVKFIDRTFNCNPARTLAVWNYIREHDNGVTNFHFEIAADLLTEEELQALAGMRPGLVQLEIGVQSTNPKTLEAICRKTDLKRLEKNVAAVRAAYNVHIHLDLIAGLPYEDYDSFAASFNDVYAMRPNQLQLGFLKVLKGSPMYADAERFGIIYTGRAPYEVLYSKWLPYEKVTALKRIEEMVEIYYNSGQFTHVLQALEQAFPTPFVLYEKLAEWYAAKGYAAVQPARSRRYHILLEFAAAYDARREEAYRELCTFDLYLRENVKSRPDFAMEWKEHTALCPKQRTKHTHSEAFLYPVWEMDPEAACSKLEKPAVVVFDYEHRNPLDQSAAWTIDTRTG